MNELELTIRRTIAAPRQKVFEAWLAPDMLAQFMRPCQGSTGPSRVANDPVVGGQFSITMLMEKGDVPHSGTYLEIDPHRRLAFTWESPHSIDGSTVTIDFEEKDASSTDITLKQVKFRSEQARNGHIGGWTEILDNLEPLVGIQAAAS